MEHTVRIVLPEPIGRIAPEIYGHFSEHIGGVFYDGLWVGKDSSVPNIRGFRKDLIEKLKKIAPPVLRWPGGCFAETYDWRDGIGENRPVRPNWWLRNDGRYESNAVGTHEFVDLCEIIGAKPYFAVNVTSLDPMSARDWMDYCLSPRGSTTLALEREKNGNPEPFDIPFWGIGNENWGGGGNMTPESYALTYRRYATIMDSVACGRVELIAGGANGAHYEWTRGLVGSLAASSGTPVNGMSFHYYCGASGGAVDFGTEDFYVLVEKAARMEELIIRHHAVVRGYGMQKKLPLVIDEWGCWHPEGSGPSRGKNLFEQQSTMRDAVISALTLNIFNNHCEKIRMANVAQLCNNLHCLFLAGSEHCIVTPTYHVFELFRPHQGGTALRTLVSGNGDFRRAVSVSASVKDGKLTLTAANLSCEESAEIAPVLLGGTLPDRADCVLLTSGDVRDHNSFEEPEKVAPTEFTQDPGKGFVLPPASVLRVEFDV